MTEHNSSGVCFWCIQSMQSYILSFSHVPGSEVLMLIVFMMRLRLCALAETFILFHAT